jgi:hypothetical protein
MGVFQLVQHRLVVLLEVFVYDDLDLVLVSLRHLDRPPTEDRDARDAIVHEHLMEHARADEAGRACENEMNHCKTVLEAVLLRLSRWVSVYNVFYTDLPTRNVSIFSVVLGRGSPAGLLGNKGTGCQLGVKGTRTSREKGWWSAIAVNRPLLIHYDLIGWRRSMPGARLAAKAARVGGH